MSQQTTLHRYEGRDATVTYDVKRCIHAGGVCARFAGGVQREGETMGQS